MLVKLEFDSSSFHTFQPYHENRQLQLQTKKIATRKKGPMLSILRDTKLKTRSIRNTPHSRRSQQGSAELPKPSSIPIWKQNEKTTEDRDSPKALNRIKISITIVIHPGFKTRIRFQLVPRIPTNTMRIGNYYSKQKNL